MTIHYTVHKETDLDYSIIHLRSKLQAMCTKPNETKFFNFSQKPFLGEVNEKSFWMETQNSIFYNHFGTRRYLFTQVLGTFDYEGEQLKLNLFCRIKPALTYWILLSLPLNAFLVYSMWKDYQSFSFLWIITVFLFLVVIAINIKKDLLHFIQLLKEDND